MISSNTNTAIQMCHKIFNFIISYKMLNIFYSLLGKKHFQWKIIKNYVSKQFRAQGLHMHAFLLSSYILVNSLMMFAFGLMIFCCCFFPEYFSFLPLKSAKQPHGYFCFTIYKLETGSLYNTL